MQSVADAGMNCNLSGGSEMSLYIIPPICNDSIMTIRHNVELHD